MKTFLRRSAGEEYEAPAADGPALVCRGVDVAYDKVQVLFGVDLDVERHEIVALLGTNGAGKSTLLKTITGLLPARSGRVTFAGIDITAKSTEQIVAAGITMMPGGPRLLHRKHPHRAAIGNFGIFTREEPIQIVVHAARIHAPSGLHRDVLRPVDLITHGSGHRNALDRHLPELLTVVGAIDGQGTVDGSLHEEVAGR